MEPRKWFDDSRWSYMGVDDDGALYYMDKESTWKDGDGIKVEIRAIPLQDNNQSDIPTGTSYIYQLWKVYPDKHVFDLLNFRFYDADGRLIPFVSHQGHMEIEIKPGSVAEKILLAASGNTKQSKISTIITVVVVFIVLSISKGFARMLGMDVILIALTCWAWKRGWKWQAILPGGMRYCQ